MTACTPAFEAYGAARPGDENRYRNVRYVCACGWVGGMQPRPDLALRELSIHLGIPRKPKKETTK